jgi:pimeloyl-ACP methyl ester carboxylesterase
MAAVGVRFKEQAVLLGTGRSLLGIVARPFVAQRSEEPVIVVINTGVVHRVGHHRMYVTLSRLLASTGRTVVRFDLSGIGDSPPRGDQLTPLVAALTDIKEVLDSLQSLHQASRFILIGLCSGADHAVLYAHSDPRIVGLVLMDPTLPPTTRYYFHYIMQRLGNVRNWISVVTGRSGLLRLVTSHLTSRVRPRGDLQGLTLQNLQFSDYLARCYRAAVARRIRILAVFTSVSTRHTYGQQWLDAFPELSSTSATRLEFFSDSDHVFSTEKNRTRLFRVIGDWLESE